MLAGAAASALIALTVHLPVPAVTAASALLAPTALSPVLAEAAASTPLAVLVYSLVLADVAPFGPLYGWFHRPLSVVGAIRHFVSPWRPGPSMFGPPTGKRDPADQWPGGRATCCAVEGPQRRGQKYRRLPFFCADLRADWTIGQLEACRTNCKRAETRL